MRTLAALLLAIPAAAQTLDYRTLCGATEGTGDNNDFCTFWERGDYQEMRHALGIAIRTARAAENRNRYYFDHKRGAERGAFIQLKRDWMGDEWQVTRETDPQTNGVEIMLFNRERDIVIEIELIPFYDELVPDATRLGESGYSVQVRAYGSIEGYPFRSIIGRNRDSDFVRRIVECKIDEYGWAASEVEVRPSCEA